jgi:hypothetical protein
VQQQRNCSWLAFWSIGAAGVTGALFGLRGSLLAMVVVAVATFADFDVVCSGMLTSVTG